MRALESGAQNARRLAKIVFSGLLRWSGGEKSGLIQQYQLRGRSRRFWAEKADVVVTALSHSEGNWHGILNFDQIACPSKCENATLESALGVRGIDWCGHLQRVQSSVPSDHDRIA